MNNPFVIFFITTFCLLLTGCGNTGACVGQYGVGKYECKEDWYKEECEAWDEDQVNGSDWIFHSRKSCESLGYTNMCSDGSYVEGSCY